MSKKENNPVKDAKNGCLALIGLSVLILILTILSILVQCVPLVTPIVFLIMFLVNRYTYRHTDWLHIFNGFWLLESEKEDFIRVGSIIYHAKVNKNNVHAAVQNEGIHINQNGRISAKSYRGKHLRNTLEDANATIDEYLPIYEHLKNTPKNRWKTARKHFARYKGAGWACVVWVAFIVFSAGNPIPGFKQYVSNIGQTGEWGISAILDLWDFSSGSSSDTIAVSSGEQPTDAREASEEVSVENNSQTEFAGILWTAVFFSLIVYAVLMAVATIVFRTKYKCPPQVDMENVESYNIHYDPRPKKKTPKDKKEKQFQKTDMENVAIKSIPAPVVENVEEEKLPLKKETYCSNEHEAFHSWAEKLKFEGYIPTGTWENWTTAGQWKNLSVKLPLSDIEIRVTVEYDAKSKKTYCGIQKVSEQEQVSQQLLDSEKFKEIMNKTGMSVKNNEWWYCLKFVSFSHAYEELHKLIGVIAESK